MYGNSHAGDVIVGLNWWHCLENYSHAGDVVVDLTWWYWLELVIGRFGCWFELVALFGISHAGDVVVGLTWWNWLELFMREVWLLV